MQPSHTFKTTFLKLMIKGLNLPGLHSKGMSSLQERKRAIKLSADAAMALARGSSTKWSTSLIKDLSKQEKLTNNKALDRHENTTINGKEFCKWKIPTSRKILRRSLRSRSRMKNVEASVVARGMVKNRTQMLKRIIPGGDQSSDSFSLLGETLDYVIHLQAQVNLMQFLAKALGASNLKYVHQTMQME